MIIYQDKEIVVCEKPYGVSSQLSGGENMVDILKGVCGCEIYPVHRLDTQTTGLIVFAKTEESAKSLSAQVSQRAMEKEYFCLCHGELEERGEMVDYLFHDRLKNKSFTVKTKRAGAKEARLEFKKISEIYKGECGLNLVRVKLHTGRTHQIRVQFSSRGNILYGDGKYGAKDNDKIALHSAYLSFNHPKTNQRLEFESTPEWAE